MPSVFRNKGVTYSFATGSIMGALAGYSKGTQKKYLSMYVVKFVEERCRNARNCRTILFEIIVDHQEGFGLNKPNMGSSRVKEIAKTGRQSFCQKCQVVGNRN